MYISDFALHDFRSYEQVVLHFEPGVTAFVGENGQGKTNIVEAIDYLSTFSSHRVNADSALVRLGASAAVIRARSHQGSHSSLLELEILAGKANRARLNRGQAKPADLLGIVRTVIFSPDDLHLVTGEPAGRRRFLDQLMIQRRPKMRAVKADYEKVLRQRAAVLKKAGKMCRIGRGFDESSLDVWDSQMVVLGSQIMKERVEIISQLRPHVNSYYAQVSGQANAQARIEYDANLYVASSACDTSWAVSTPHTIDGESNEDSDAAYQNGERRVDETTEQKENKPTNIEEISTVFAHALTEKRQREIDAGMNLVGPHRDDMSLTLGPLPAKGYASHGESWSYALALRLASWQVLRDVPWTDRDESHEPILILDDVFAELDARRRERLVALIESAEQVFVTAAVGDDLPSNLSATRYRVHRGSVTLESENPAADADGDGEDRCYQQSTPKACEISQKQGRDDE